MRAILILTFSLLFCTSAFSQSQRQSFYSDKAPKPIGPYSQAIGAGNLVFVSGQIALRQDGSMDTTTIDNEVKLVMSNIKAVLEAAKLDMKHVVKSTIYVTDLRNFKRINEIYGSFFGESPPARETVEVRALPKGAHVEISVIASR